MKEVLRFIEQKKQEFARMPLFEFMRDTSIDPRQRLSFAPCLAPFVMAFGELNKSVFRDEPTNDPIQKLINKHTREDDHHWLWYLEDLQRLELNQPVKMTEALRFLWSEETTASRRLVYELYRLTYQATPLQKLVVIECVEATGNVMFSNASLVNQKLKNNSQVELIYFGNFHLSVETGHTTGTEDVTDWLQNLNFTVQDREQAFKIVNEVFGIFSDLINSLQLYLEKKDVFLNLQPA
jgi:hypothetical protein